jgi:hypothetical protein
MSLVWPTVMACFTSLKTLQLHDLPPTFLPSLFTSMIEDFVIDSRIPLWLAEDQCLLPVLETIRVFNIRFPDLADHIPSNLLASLTSDSVSLAHGWTPFSHGIHTLVIYLGTRLALGFGICEVQLEDCVNVTPEDVKRLEFVVPSFLWNGDG